MRGSIKSVKFKPKNDISNKIFGKIKVIEPAFSHNKILYWKCECECGEIRYHTKSNLLSGIKSCGCVGNQQGNKHKCWRGYGELSQAVINRIEKRAKKRKIEYNLTLEYLWNLFLKQERKCVYTGIEITLPKNSKDFHLGHRTASLDRIDSTIGYIEGNVQWVHVDINFMKQSFTHDYFLLMCSLVTNKNSCINQSSA